MIPCSTAIRPHLDRTGVGTYKGPVEIIKDEREISDNDIAPALVPLKGSCDEYGFETGKRLPNVL